MQISTPDPGTGKTFIAKRVMQVLLDNADHWYGQLKTPILLICYTNHALDQFIEGILDFEESIVRYGGNSKNERVAEYSIREQRMKQYRSNPNRSLYRQSKIAEEAVAAVQDKRFAFEEAFERAFTDVVCPEKLYNAGSITVDQYEFILNELKAKLDDKTFKYLEQPIDEDPKSNALNLMKVWLGLDYRPYLNENLIQPGVQTRKLRKNAKRSENISLRNFSNQISFAFASQFFSRKILLCFRNRLLAEICTPDTATG